MRGQNLYYSGRIGAGRKATPAELPTLMRSDQIRPEGYRADDGLVDAVNVALLLGQPLLVTGEPGTGKTQLAYSLAWELGYGPPLRFDTKSTSTASELFYTYNSLARFHGAYSGTPTMRGAEFITYNALGLAILLANIPEDVAEFVPHDFKHGGKRRSIVLIDEVDKAPRDFPNDILNEVEEMSFRIPELNNVKIEADPALRPIPIITSNSEKNLPDAFLRRCIYYNIPFPNRARLAEIVGARLGQVEDRPGTFLGDALNLFERLRLSASGLRKKPATSELLGWLVALRRSDPSIPNPLRTAPDTVLSTVCSLVKTADDQELAQRIVSQWIKSPD